MPKRMIIIIASVLTVFSICLSGILHNFVIAQDAAIPGTTRSLVNLRSGPGTRFHVISVLPADMPLIFTGRNTSSTWLLTQVGGQTGWLSYTFVSVLGDVTQLPVVDGVEPLSTGGDNPLFAPPPMNPNVEPAMPGVVPQISATTRQIFLQGQELGNYAGVFAKVGDSITASQLFLTPIGLGQMQLGDYEYLQPVIDFFSQMPARDHYSFASTSVAARGGWSTFDVLDPKRSVAGICLPGEMPLICEYRINRPSIALIMFGTNDLNWVENSAFRANTERIVQLTIDRGVIPVLSTIPDQPISRFSSRVVEFNEIIIDIAFTYDVPLWNYWLALQELPNRGLAGDNIHPSYDVVTRNTALFSADGLQYGYNMRNLTALMVLDAIWRGAIY